MKTGIRFILFFALLIITTLPAAADPGLGSSPYAAKSLSSGLNVGTLGPGEDFWYTFSNADLGDRPAHTVVLNMVYKPGGHDVAAYVNFKVFTFDQVDRWLQGYADQYTGMGVFTTTDFDQDTAERLWSGRLLEGETYYVYLFNNSNTATEYHLTALGQPEADAAGAEEGLATPVSNTKTSPASSIGGALKPGTTAEETQWLLVAAAVQGMSAEDIAAWLMMANQVGWLPGAEAADSVKARATTYSVQPRYTQLERAALTEVIEAPRGAVEETSQVESAPSLFDLYPNVYPNAPLAMHDGVNVGRLAPGGERWYSFIREDRDDEWYEFMPLTLFSTPPDGNESHHINFQIFTGDQLHVWKRGTPEDMVPMGAGQWVSRDKDPVTGERVWAGHVVDGDTYYVRVFNHTNKVIDYYLITGDILNTELGDRVWAANPSYRHTLWQPGDPIPPRY